MIIGNVDFTPLFAFLGILLSSIVIDFITLGVIYTEQTYKFIFGTKKEEIPLPTKYKKISIIIPAYNEEKNIYMAVYRAFNQKLPPKQVIVVDDHSTDRTLDECLRAQKKFKKLRILSRRQNRGKAENINFVLEKMPLQEITVILDADTFLTRSYLENIIKPFKNEKVVIVTGTSLPVRHLGFLSDIIFRGSTFLYRFFCFRKRAQSYRNAVSVITGDSAAYRTSFLKEVGGLPEGTQTEDMDITWVALENHYKVAYQKNALARSKDAATLKGHWKQITRWYAGGFQCLIKHNFKLWKAKPLLFTTLTPSYIDSFLYSISLLIAGLFFFIFKPYAIGFFSADLLFTTIAISIVNWKEIIYLPHIYIMKFIWAFAYIYAALKTILQFIMGKRNWGGGWDRSSFYKTI